MVVEARYTGTYKATGKEIDAQDGKVTKFQQYVDTAHLQDVMGASVTK